MFGKRSVLPGFGLSFGFTTLYLSLLVLLPLSALLLHASSLSVAELLRIITEPRVLAAFRLSFGTALVASLINAVFGVLLAWVLTRYEFAGRAIADAIVDLPFALPTAVAGIALTTLYAETGLFGAQLARLGWKSAFSPLGITIALVFVGIPFVVRTVQPVLEDLDIDVEEAAESLGATRAQIFWRVILPMLRPAIGTGFALAFARSLGEYGSVVFISGNMPRLTEIAPVLIVVKLEQYDYKGATAIASTMLLASLAILFAVNVLSRSQQRLTLR